MSLALLIDSAIKQHRLPSDFSQIVEQWYQPLSERMVQRITDVKREKHRPYFLGLQGLQGSGKSTCAAFLKILLESKGLSTVVMSIDDFYLTREARTTLACDVHPLFQTRGVPGTHDTKHLLSVFQELSQLDNQGSVSIPRFDKSVDNRCEPDQWYVQKGTVDVVILEGWCVGLGEQPSRLLMEPVNALEADEDTEGLWRSFVNQQLKGEYSRVFQWLDDVLVIQAPSFECVYEWRALQEHKLIQSLKSARPDSSQSDSSQSESSQSESPQLENPPQNRTLNEAALKRFIAHYERLSRHALTSLPDQASWVFLLDDEHRIREFIDKRSDKPL